MKIMRRLVSGGGKKVYVSGCGIFFGRYYGAPCSDSLSRLSVIKIGSRLFLKNKCKKAVDRKTICDRLSVPSAENAADMLCARLKVFVL